MSAGPRSRPARKYQEQNRKPNQIFSYISEWKTYADKYNSQKKFQNNIFTTSTAADELMPVIELRNGIQEVLTESFPSDVFRLEVEHQKSGASTSMISSCDFHDSYIENNMENTAIEAVHDEIVLLETGVNKHTNENHYEDSSQTSLPLDIIQNVHRIYRKPRFVIRRIHVNLRPKKKSRLRNNEKDGGYEDDSENDDSANDAIQNKESKLKLGDPPEDSLQNVDLPLWRKQHYETLQNDSKVKKSCELKKGVFRFGFSLDPYPMRRKLISPGYSFRFTNFYLWNWKTRTRY